MVPIKYFCAWWGLEHLGLDEMLNKIKDAGYDGVEIGIPFNKREQDKLLNLLNKLNLEVIAHQYQAQGSTCLDYLPDFKQSLKIAASFNPLLINSHTGKDYWNIDENCVLINAAEEISKKYNIPIIHETHRSRFLYSAPVARQYFQRLPKLKINADFSHWVCVSESLLEDQTEVLNEAILRARHIHARVGFAEGPQIPDPTAAEWKTELESFIKWWKQIAKNFEKLKKPFLTITPEFGPAPYTWVLQNKPVNSHWDINIKMREILKQHFKS